MIRNISETGRKMLLKMWKETGLRKGKLVKKKKARIPFRLSHKTLIH